MSSVPNGAVVDQATLQLYASLVGENGSVSVNAVSCSDTTWTELTLTYSNMPSGGMIAMDYALVSTSNQWYNWSVVDAVRNALKGNPKAVTIALMTSLNSSASSAWFYSKEAPVSFTDYAPRLTVYWSGTPPPTTSVTTFGIIGGVVLLVITIVGVFLLKKRENELIRRLHEG